MKVKPKASAPPPPEPQVFGRRVRSRDRQRAREPLCRRLNQVQSVDSEEGRSLWLRPSLCLREQFDMANRLKALLGAVQAVSLVVLTLLLGGSPRTTCPDQPAPAGAGRFQGRDRRHRIRRTARARTLVAGVRRPCSRSVGASRHGAQPEYRSDQRPAVTCPGTLARCGCRPLAAGRAARQRRSAGGPLVNAAGDEGNLFMGALSLAWEVDLFGRLNHARQAASLDVATRQSLLREAHLLVQIDLVRGYLAVRALDAERRLAQTLADDVRALVLIAERRFSNGQLSAVAVARARLDGAAAEAELPDLDWRRDTLEHALALLLGELPMEFSLPPEPVELAGDPGSIRSARSVLIGPARCQLHVTPCWRPASVSASPQVPAHLRCRSRRRAGWPPPVLVRCWPCRRARGALASLPASPCLTEGAGIPGSRWPGPISMPRRRSTGRVTWEPCGTWKTSSPRFVRWLRRRRLWVFPSISPDKSAKSRICGGAGHGERDGATPRANRPPASWRRGLQIQSAQLQASVTLVRALGGGWEWHVTAALQC